MNYVKFSARQICPSKIICVGRNYVAHIKELGNALPEQPVLFIKPNSAISHELVSSDNELIHYEGEITFLVIAGKFAGVGFGLDLTKRQLQDRLKAKGLPWERAKAFDKSAVFSDFVPFAGETDALRMELSINGALAQAGGYDAMLHKPADLLKEITGSFSLEDGDLIMTGTPKGVGAINRGDEFTGKIFAGAKLLVEASWVVK